MNLMKATFSFKTLKSLLVHFLENIKKNCVFTYRHISLFEKNCSKNSRIVKLILTEKERHVSDACIPQKVRGFK